MDEGRGLVFGYSVNREPIRKADTLPSDYHAGDTTCEYWCQGVLNQVHRCRVRIQLKEGLNKLRIYAVDAPLVLERFRIWPEHMKTENSYLGPEESYRIKSGG